MSIDNAIQDAAQILGDAGIETARLDARCLLGQVLSMPPISLAGRRDEVLSTEALRRFGKLVAQRSARTPVSRILGEREFWSMPFTISGSVLDPRADSECLIEALLSRINDRAAALRILDLGTGSGCLLAALLCELPMSTGLGVDIVPDALIVARSNLIRNGLAQRAQFLCGDWAQALCGETFDVVLVNPPYIRASDAGTLAPEVIDHDPHVALFGGSDGLAAYRKILPDLSRLMRLGGIVAVEIGLGQQVAVSTMLKAAGFPDVECRRDLAGVERCLSARLEAQECQDKKRAWNGGMRPLGSGSGFDGKTKSITDRRIHPSNAERTSVRRSSTVRERRGPAKQPL
ncbi:MAG: protein-(glutamine-N5) methyltransferase, release factor-specific [Alphaproteobacteria bacterium]|nr:protein-(glutamine-N5) methyltransferase, release factor-specific [Alphaproteobacteria bacterium]